MEEIEFDLDIIIPVYNEESGISIIYEEILKTLKVENLSWRVIFIDDGSKDNTFREIQSLKKNYKNICSIKFLKNFGHQAALKAGILHSNANFLVMMDGDLQHPPSLIPALIKEARNGANIVQTVRLDDDSEISLFKKITSKFYYDILSRFSEVKIPRGCADFRLVTREVVNHVKNIGLKDVFWRGYFFWLGYEVKMVEYSPQKRRWGESKYSLNKMMQLALSGVMSFSLSPLRVATLFGFSMMFASFVYLAYAIILFIFTEESVPGWTSVIAVVIMLSSVQLLVLGVLAEYIAKIFSYSSNKPEFIIDQKEV